MRFVIGGRGRLGQALAAQLPDGDSQALDRSVYAGWTETGAASDVTRFFRPFADQNSTVFMAAGVTDPRRSAADHVAVNLTLPQNVIEGVRKLGIRVITFGTIMEQIVGRSTGNPYVDSKLALSDAIQDAVHGGADILHIRIHTLYGGGPPDPFMFLGQLLDAIRRRQPFRMSAGTQLREYHHIDDEIKAIAVLAQSGMTGAIDLSHGAPIRLIDLASFICEQLRCPDLLHAGVLPSSGNDNYDRIFEPVPILRAIGFRDTMSSVLSYIKLHSAEP